MTIKAIETVYNGYRFRSRLEARWAVFFDALGVKYEYELEGFDLGHLGWYLPDFFLPHSGFFVEVKPTQLTDTERLKVNELDGHPPQYARGCFPVIGPPEMPAFDIRGDSFETARLHGWSGNTAFLILHEGTTGEMSFPTPQDVNHAIVTARQARFEHGETPRVA